MKTVYITRTHITQDSIDDLDFEMYTEFGVDTDLNDNLDVIENSSIHKYGTEGDIVQLNRLIRYLTSLKSKGVTHVSLEDNCDHHGYEFSGYEYHKSTPSEVTQYRGQTIAKQEELKKAEILRLEEKLAKLKE